MSQNIVDFSGNPTGSGLLDDYLDKELQNILTSNSGIQRPSYAVAGTKWLDTSVTPWLWKMYDGTEDVVIGTVDTSAHKFVGGTPMTTTGDLIVQNEDGNPARLASGTAGTVLTSNGVGQIPSWQKSPYQTLDNLSQTLDTSTEKYPSNAAVKAAIDTKITNCITEIPQDIKLELNDGVLTLKAGSKIYIPNGFEADGTTKKFDELVIASDMTGINNLDMKTTGTTFIRYENGILMSDWLVSTFSSGSDSSSVTGWYYNVAKNELKYYHSGVAQDHIVGFPLGVATLSEGVVTSIDQVFNGFGYIGSTAFALPGVKGLIPNGRNEDGSLNNIEFTLDKVATVTLTSGLYSKFVVQVNAYYITVVDVLNYFEQDEEPTGLSSWVVWLNTKNNIPYIKNFSDSSSSWTPQYICNNPAIIECEDGKITSFTPKTAFHAVDYNDAPKLATDNNFTGTNTFGKTIEIDSQIDMLSLHSCKENVYGGGDIFMTKANNGNTYSVIRCLSKTNEWRGQIGFISNDDGETWQTECTINPPLDANSTQITTTSWVRSYVKNYRAQLNYAAGVTITSGATIPASGVLIINESTGSGFREGSLKVNSTTIAVWTTLDGTDSCQSYPVKAGDIVEFTNVATAILYPYM